MKGTKLKYAFIASVLMAPLIVLGQETPIDVSAEGDRHVEEAYRIAINPRIKDTLLPTVLVDYPLLSLKYETQTELERINPASIKTIEKLSQLYNTYIKLGVGTEFMPLGEVYFNSKRSRKYVYGAHLKHLSSFGDITDYAPASFDRTKFNLYGGLNERKYSLRGDIHYNNQGLNYYGISDTLGLTTDSIRQRYSDFGISASYASHEKDSAKVNYTVGLAYNNYLSKKPDLEENKDWRARENYFGITSSAWYKYGRETYAADLNIKYNGYKYGAPDTSLTGLDTGIVLNNTVINLKPTITTRIQDYRFKAKIGLDVTLDIHNTTKIYIYPLAELKYSMFNDIFIPYAGVRGGMKQTTFKGLTQENEFLVPNVEMRNENTRIDFYGGIKGTLSKRLSFNAGISFASVQDKALFITDTTFSLGNKFDVVFDTMNITTIEASISYQLKEKLKLDGIARYYSYSAKNNNYAWNLPQFQFIIRGSYNLFDKFMIRADINMEQGRKALIYRMEDNVVIENGQYVKTLNFITDANLEVEYRYNKRISAFIQLNNIGAQRYMRWYNTPVHGLQFLGGVTFRI